MDSTEGSRSIPSDFDGIVLDSIPTNDGIWALYGIDDDRAVWAWSSHHATRCVEQLAIARDRVRIAEWTLADVQRRGLTGATAKAAAHAARARADLADWEAKARQLEAHRKTTSWAWKTPLIQE